MTFALTMLGFSLMIGAGLADALGWTDDRSVIAGCFYAGALIIVAVTTGEMFG